MSKRDDLVALQQNYENGRKAVMNELLPKWQKIINEDVKKMASAGYKYYDCERNIPELKNYEYEQFFKLVADNLQVKYLRQQRIGTYDWDGAPHVYYVHMFYGW